MDISNKLQIALNDIDKNFKFVKNKIETKQDAITSNDKLDYSLLSGTPTIPTKTSDLTNDSGFIAPSGGTEGQVLTKTANGEEWADAQGGTIKVDDKVASGAFVVDFAGAQIQKYDVDSAVSGTFTVQYENLDIPEGTAPTVELQVPVTGDVSNIILPSDTSVIDMPVILEGGQFNYHDIVFRAQRDFGGAIKVYTNYAYQFKEEIDYLYIEALEANDEVTLYFRDGVGSMSVDVQYSTDKENWTTYNIADVITLANVGDRVYFRGNNPESFSQDYNFAAFSQSKMSKAGGNIMSLLNHMAMNIELPYAAFRNVFFSCGNLYDVSDLKLPATTLASRCYSGMFMYCDHITKAPKILATTLASNCFKDTFSGCSSLNEIEVHFTNWNDWNSTSQWVYNVASSGTFKCPASLPIIYDPAGVPSNWTVVNI